MSHHIAIIGTEGSGKTILATVWARRLAYSTDAQLFLSYQNIDTEKYVERAWDNLNKGQWLPSTPQGSRTELEWQLQLGETFKCPIKLIDLPGQDLRNFFSGNYGSFSTDTKALFEYVSSASIVFAVVNLKRILKEPQSEDRIVLSEIVRFLSTNAESHHLYFVFTAWDEVASEVLDKYGSLTEYIKRELTPFYRTCENAWKQEGKGIYFLAVAPIAQTVYDVQNKEFVPQKGFASYNLENFTKVLIQSIGTLQKGTKKHAWDEAVVHPYDELLLSEWRNREGAAKRKKIWNTFWGIRESQETLTTKRALLTIISYVVIGVCAGLGSVIGAFAGTIVGVIVGGILTLGFYYSEVGAFGMFIGFCGGLFFGGAFGAGLVDSISPFPSMSKNKG
jgi:hypothetical protein